jgi:ABC-type multidrug transport system fused ATPase/permease subunit
VETFGDFFLTIIWIFALVAYLIILFFILTDMFRDHELSGWWKAVWIVFLIFLPFLTALVYLIARGPGMQKRGMAAAQEMQEQQNAYIRQTISRKDPADQIASAKALHDQGVITDEEFAQLKSKALS